MLRRIGECIHFITYIYIYTYTSYVYSWPDDGMVYETTENLGVYHETEAQSAVAGGGRY